MLPAETSYSIGDGLMKSKFFKELEQSRGLAIMVNSFVIEKFETVSSIEHLKQTYSVKPSGIVLTINPKFGSVTLTLSGYESKPTQSYE